MKRASEKLIGLFVLSSIAIMLLAVVALGSASFFSEKRTFVMYFTDSVNGLNEGAPVKFRGVKIGEVKKVALQVDVKEHEINLPIIIEIDSSHLILKGKFDTNKTNFIKYLIGKGLRATLKSESLITGLLYIEMDFHPEIPEVYQTNATSYLQIPTIPSSAQAMMNTFEAANKTLNAITKFVKSKELATLIKSANSSFIEANVVLGNINNKVDPLNVSLQQSLVESKYALRSLKVLADYLEQHPESIIFGKRGSR